MSDRKNWSMDRALVPEDDLDWLQEALRVSSIEDLISRALRLLAVLVRESRRGCSIYVGFDEGPKLRLLLPELAPAGPRPPSPRDPADPATGEDLPPWRRRLHDGGRRLLASLGWSAKPDAPSPREAAENWLLKKMGAS